MSFLKNLGSAFSEAVKTFILTLAAKFAREYLAGEIQDYQSFVYPPLNNTFGDAYGMWTPIWANLTGTKQLIVDWDMLLYTSNVTGDSIPFPQDVNLGTASLYHGQLDLHGRHDLVSWTVYPGQTPQFFTYNMLLHGLTQDNTMSFTQAQIDNNGLAELDNLIIWTWPFLVKACGEHWTEDTTRLYGQRAIILEKGGLLILFTRIDSRFNQPDDPYASVPLWTTNPFNGGGIIANNVFLFCGKPIPATDGQDQISENGIPTNTTNEAAVIDVQTPVGPFII